MVKKYTMRAAVLGCLFAVPQIMQGMGAIPLAVLAAVPNAVALFGVSGCAYFGLKKYFTDPQIVAVREDIKQAREDIASLKKQLTEARSALQQDIANVPEKTKETLEPKFTGIATAIESAESRMQQSMRTNHEEDQKRFEGLKQDLATIKKDLQVLVEAHRQREEEEQTPGNVERPQDQGLNNANLTLGIITSQFEELQRDYRRLSARTAENNCMLRALCQAAQLSGFDHQPVVVSHPKSTIGSVDCAQQPLRSVVAVPSSPLTKRGAVCQNSLRFFSITSPNKNTWLRNLLAEIGQNGSQLPEAESKDKGETCEQARAENRQEVVPLVQSEDNHRLGFCSGRRQRSVVGTLVLPLFFNEVSVLRLGSAGHGLECAFRGKPISLRPPTVFGRDYSGRIETPDDF